MRVLFLTDSLSDLDGVGRYAVRLIRALEEVEPSLQVEVLLARKHRPTSADVPGHWKVRVALPPDYFFYMSPLRYWASLVTGTWRTWRAARNADLVHAIKDFPHNLVGLLGARLAGVPCIATAHGTYSVQPLVTRRHAAAARWAYARFAGMICVSRYTAGKLRQLVELPADRVHVIPNAVSPEHYFEPRAVGERPWHGVPFTLSVGELKERKGHHLALAAWVRVARERPELHHFVIGKGSGDEYEERLHGIVAEVADRVHFLGNVTEDEKVDLQQRAQVFVHTPVTSVEGGFEGFGIVYLEAAAAGTPSIGTLDSGAEDAVVDGESGFLVPQDEDAVVQALERLLDDEGLRARLGEEARAVAQRSGWRANAERVLAIYREALA